MNEGDQRVWLSANELAEATGHSINSVWYWCRTGEMPHTRIAGSIRIHREVLDQMLLHELRSLANEEAA